MTLPPYVKQESPHNGTSTDQKQQRIADALSSIKIGDSVIDGFFPFVQSRQIYSLEISLYQAKKKRKLLCLVLWLTLAPLLYSLVGLLYIYA